MSSAFPRCSTADELLADCLQVFLHPVERGRISSSAPTEVAWINRDARWSDVQEHAITMCKSSFKTTPSTFCFKYLDDDNDAVEISSDAEWQEAVRVSGISDSQGGREVHLMVTAATKTTCPTLGSKQAQARGERRCQPSSGCCKPRVAVSKSSCGPSTKSACCSSRFAKPQDCRFSAPECCAASDVDVTEYIRELPPDPKIPADRPKVQSKIVNPTLGEYKYFGEFLRAVALPLGPIGGGVIALAGDGGLRQWQVSNTIDHDAHVPDSFFAIKVETGEKTVAKILQSDALYGPPPAGYVPAPYITDAYVPEGSVQLLKTLPFGVPEIEITAKYPIVEVEYPNSGLPVDVKLETFNPCIPFDSKSSAYPAIIFNFSVTNTSDEAVQVTMLNSQQNFAGWDGHAEITDEVCDANYGGNANQLLSLNGMTAIDMSNPTLDMYGNSNGHVANAVLTEVGDNVSSMMQFDSVAIMWKNFISSKGLPGQGSKGLSPAGKTWNGALALTRELEANETKVFTFILAWHFPHRYQNWSQAGFGIKDDPKSKWYLGNQYTNFWPSIGEVLESLRDNMDYLTTTTRNFRDAMYSSNLPWQLIDSAAGRISPVRSPTGMWLGDGRFYAFEGCSKDKGCCPLNCTHVWNYEMSLARLWPDVERTMREVEYLTGQLCPSYKMMSRVTVPLDLRRWFTTQNNYEPSTSSTAACVDGEIGSVLKVYREVRMGASREWLDSIWPGVQGVLNRWMAVMDDVDPTTKAHKGTVSIAQPNTYDTAIYGVNTFIGTLYLCALRVGEELATLLGNKTLAAQYHARFETGSANLDKACYTNGMWYTQVVDPAHKVELLSDSSFIDSLLGQWWAHCLNLGDILPIDHCKSTCEYIMKNNHVDSCDPAVQYPRKFCTENDSGLFLARWPGQSPPSNAMRYTSEIAWSGLEHEFAGLCVYQGQVDIATQVLEECRQKHDGWRRSPWNEVECGDHYSRQMSGFQLFDAASGLMWSATFDGGLSISFNPVIESLDFRGFFSLTEGWGQFAQKVDSKEITGTASLEVVGGQVVLKQFNLPFFNSTGKTVTVKLGETTESPQVTQSAQGLSLMFAQPITVKGTETSAGILSISVAA